MGHVSRARIGSSAPIPLFAGFGLFLIAIAYLIAASLTRRSAPVFAASPASRVRSADWERLGDTLTIDATDGDRWQYVSLSLGRVLASPDTSGWEIAVQRYRVIAQGAIADLGDRPFERADMPAPTFVTTAPGPVPENAAIRHWYRYNLLTHLLEPNGHLYAVRDAGGRLWKLQVVSYYCPGLTAGCLTVHYGPIAWPAASR